jgi:hypothetical protein
VIDANRSNYLINQSAIWICTDFSTQTEALKLLRQESFPGCVIIEKPIAENQSDLALLISAKKEIPGLSISNPWTYSEMWTSFKRDFFQIGKKFEISIVREGPRVRSYMAPPKDWLFHDILLAQNLGKDLNEKLVFVSSELQDQKLYCKMSAQIGSSITVDMQGGYSRQKKAQWIITQGKQKVLMDFSLNRATYLKSESAKLEPEIHTYSDNPLITMLMGLIQVELSIDDYGRALRTLKEFDSKFI